MPKHNYRHDVTKEKCKKLYKKYQNATMVAEILNCSLSIVLDRLDDIDTSVNCEKKRYKKDKRVKLPRKIFKSKEDQAKYICRELSEPLAELLLQIRAEMEKKK